ncbi:hypothetical protein [Nocardia otitidiscaviarum]|uniref:hypothetical protein n=1 Tax=Nocardia otitidiscaviarum TaxID=1823 RepID=UPI002453F221|nr:hypothetical protein [Nocardia otitidiscaviarum]
MISNDELIAAGPGAVLAQCRVQLTATWTSQYLPVVQLMHNDAAVASREVDFNTSSVTLPGTQLTLAAGDRVWVRLTNSNPLGGLTVAGGANTYVYYDLV